MKKEKGARKSTHRLSARFNAYSGLWTDFIMRDVQTAILKVLKRRCEAGEMPPAAEAG
jgi:hypothetical protein